MGLMANLIGRLSRTVTQRRVISDTLEVTKAATFCVHLPDAARKGFPMPRGTGFFISPDGWFLTAAHVITTDGKSDGPPRGDVKDATLTKEAKLWLDPKRPPASGPICLGVTLRHVDPPTDVALLKVDVAKNTEREWLKGSNGFPFVRISRRLLDDGEDVYAFGYPLSSGDIVVPGPGVIVGDMQLSPRVTSAIVASRIEKTQMITEAGIPLHYVLDKALNYGNSGGPIAATSTGNIHAFCSRFQPVFVPQFHLKDNKGRPLQLFIPSLYGVVINLGHARVRKILKEEAGIDAVE